MQVLGSAEQSYLESFSAKARVRRFRALCEQKIPCLVVSRGAHLEPALLAVAEELEIAVFRTPMVTMRFINAATIAMEADFAPTVTEFGSMVDVLGVGRFDSRPQRHREERVRAGFDRAWLQSGGG